MIKWADEFISKYAKTIGVLYLLGFLLLAAWEIFAHSDMSVKFTEFYCVVGFISFLVSWVISDF